MVMFPRQTQRPALSATESSIPEMAGVPPLPRSQLRNQIQGATQGGDTLGAGVAPYPAPAGGLQEPPLQPRADGYNVPGPTPPDSPPVLAPRSRADRLSVFRDLLAKFTYSLASAYSVPPRERIGAALMGPFAYEERAHKLDLQEAQELQRTAAVQQAMATIERQRTRLPFEVEDLLSRALRARGLDTTSQANLPLIAARTGLVGAQTGLTEARTNLTGTQTERAKIFVRPEGIFRMEDGKLAEMPGANTTTRVPITADLAKKLGIPEELAGMSLRPTDINQLRPDSPNTKVYRSADGVMLYDENTGSSTKLGNLPPSPPIQGSYRALYDQFGQIVQFFNPVTGASVDVPFAGARGGAIAPTAMARMDILNSMSENVKLLRELATRHQGVIGVITGRVAGVVRQLIDVDPEINVMFRISDNMADILLRARSGAQINEREYERLRLLVPNPRGPASKFWSDLDEFDRELQNSIKFIVPSALPTGALGAGAAGRSTVPTTPPLPTSPPSAPPAPTSPGAAERIRGIFPPGR